MRNAREALSRKLAEPASQEKLLAALAHAFGVDHPIRRVEIYDNSHIMGTNAIGAMVVAGPRGLVKNQYRTFNIRSADLTPGDDYAMMREVLTRRFARLMRQGETAEAGAFPDTPDLVVIDGGRGQFEAAREVMAALGVEGVRLASIAKGPDRNAGRETFFVEGRESVPACAARSGAVLHPAPARRSAPLRYRHPPRPAQEGIRRDPLDEIPGIGPARKRALLTPSARQRPSPAPASPTSKRRPASTRRRPSWSMTFSMTPAEAERSAPAFTAALPPPGGYILENEWQSFPHPSRPHAGIDQRAARLRARGPLRHRGQS